MGTRCLTIVKDHNDKDIIVLYRQFDGYPDGHGAELKEHFQNFTIGNGRTGKPKYANVVQCLAAQVVALCDRATGNSSGSVTIGAEHIKHIRALVAKATLPR